jgi:hypothetical protein
MAYYTTEITITLPLALSEISAKVGRSLDPDVGGANSFHRVIESYDAAGEPVYTNLIRTTSPCTEEFKTQAEYMMTDPQALHDVCSADYKIRWPEYVPPTFSECAQFVAGISELK